METIEPYDPSCTFTASISMELLAGILLYERSHASSGRPDVDRGFELKLIDYVGRLASDQITNETYSLYQTSFLPP